MKTSALVMTLSDANANPKRSMPDGTWTIAKPFAWCGMSLWNRIKACLVVLKGDGIVVRWY